MLSSLGISRRLFFCNPLGSVALVVGGFPIMMLGSPAPLLVLLVLLKIGVDVTLHARSHRVKKQGAAPAGAKGELDHQRV